MITIDNILDVTQYLDNIDVVIFDMDDTLYSEKEYVKSGYNAIEKEFIEIANMSQKLWNAFFNNKNAIDYVLEQEGLLTEENKNKALEIYRNHIPNIHLYDGIEDMLIQLKKTKKIGLITDGRPIGQRNKIKALNLEKYINEIIVTDELGGVEFRKPNSKAFELMQEKLKIPFEKMVYIGDNINKDFIAPEKLGMQVIYFRNKDGLYFKN